MKHLQLLLAVLLLASCRNGKEDIYEVATMSDRVRLEITSDGTLNHLDLLMNKEMTDMSIPWVNEGVAEIYLDSTIVWSQVKQQGGNTAPPIDRKLD